MSYRSDYCGPMPPKALAIAVAKRGGYNPYGEPMYRLVSAVHRVQPCGGTWIDWDESTPLNQRVDGLNVPLRRTVEIRDVSMYPGYDGWVLEKWIPASSYGNAEQWYRMDTAGGTMLYMPEKHKSLPMLGEYPHRGDYENVGFVFPTEALTEAVVLHAVSRLQRSLDEMPDSPKGRMLRKLYHARQAEEQRQSSMKGFYSDVLEDGDFAFKGKAFSSGSARKQQHSSKAMLERLGIGVHHI